MSFGKQARRNAIAVRRDLLKEKSQIENIWFTNKFEGRECQQN
jgi:hypothetical protein